MCKPGEPCPGADDLIERKDGLTLFEALADTRAHPGGMEYIVVAETMEPGKFGTSIQGEPEIVTKMVRSVMRTYADAYGPHELLLSVAMIIALIRKEQAKNNAENEHDPALFQQIQKK